MVQHGNVPRRSTIKALGSTWVQFGPILNPRLVHSHYKADCSAPPPLGTRHVSGPARQYRWRALFLFTPTKSVLPAAGTTEQRKGGPSRALRTSLETCAGAFNRVSGLDICAGHPAGSTPRDLPTDPCNNSKPPGSNRPANTAVGPTLAGRSG